MRQTHLIICALLTLLIGCKQNLTFLPGFEFGQPEAEWRQIQKDLVKKEVLVPKLSSHGFYTDTAYLFKWVLGDTSYAMRVYLNSDDANGEGSLRMYSMSLTQDTFPKVIPKDKIEAHSPGLFYEPAEINALKRRINSTYGKPDSVSRGDRDSSFWYKNEKYDMEVNIRDPQMSTEGPMYNTVFVTVYSKTYKADYEKFMADLGNSLTAKDLFSVDFNTPRLNTLRDEYGIGSSVLEVTSMMESSPSHLNKKEVTSAKGILRILDKYNDVLFELTDQEYQLSTPLCCGRSIFFQQAGNGWNLSLANRPETRKLREAVQRGSSIRAEFEPKTILFTDGSIWR